MIARKLRLWLLGLALLILALSLAGCAGRAAILTGSSWPGIAPTEDTIYMAYGPSVYAIDPETSSAIWTFPAEPNRNQTFYARPAVSEDTVIVADYTDTLFALNRENGSEQWAFKSDDARFIGGAVIGSEYVYAGTADGTLHALEPDTGREAWSFEAERDIWSAPLLEDGTLYVTSLDHHVYAVDAANGSMLWQYPPEGEEGDPSVGSIVGTPMIQDGTLYFGSFSNHIYALDVETHQIKWATPTSNWVWSTPVYDEVSGLLIGGDLDGNVFAIDPESGEKQWTYDAGGPVVGRPAVGNAEDGTRVVYVASDSTNDNLFILNVEDGTLADTPASLKAEFTTRFLFFSTGSSERTIPIYASPIIYNGSLLIGAHQGDYPLYALDRETLLERWHFSPPQS